MNLVGKVGDSLLLVDVKFALVLSVGHNVLSKLAARKLVQDHALFACVDDLAVVERLKLFAKLGFLGQVRQNVQNLLVNLLGRVVVCQAFRHRNGIFLYALGSVRAAQNGF